MSTQPPYIDPEVEALLWAARLASAEAWGPDDPWEDEVRDDVGQVGTGSPALDEFIERGLDREQLLFEWEQVTAQVARWHAVQVRLLAKALDQALLDGTAGDDAQRSVRSFAAELACAAALSDRVVERQMNEAAVMRDRFPATLGALSGERL